MNTTKKLLLVSASTALSFLLIMGLNTAFSANPTAVPPSTGLTPTFNKVTLGSDADGVQIDSAGLKNTGGTPFLLDSPVARKIQIASGVVLQVLTNLQVDGTAYFKNAEMGSGINPAQLKVYGMGEEGKEQLHLVYQGKFGALSNLLLSVVSGGSTIKTEQPLNLVSTSALGTISFNGWPYNTTPAKVEVNGDLTTTGTTKLLGATTIGSAVTPSNLTVTGTAYIDKIETGLPDFTINDALTVKGKVKATSFGTLTTRSVDLKATALNQVVSTPASACLTNETVISCTFKSLVSTQPWLVLSNRFLGQGCELVAKNQYSGTNTITLTSLCWNPNL
ncbi:MAG: hypothetical protein RBS56_04490 [Candidatus Gracilibacteria bacterium]|jgi:hypothetical protein|nr:hypothetical protein [Candidatus Gracilibacteria bacterium]